MNAITEILIRVAATLLVAGAIYLGKQVATVLKAKLSKEQNEVLDKLIKGFVYAAEQMLKKDDPTGSNRLAYVQQMLIDAGYELTAAIRAMIEAHVFEINKGNDAA